MHADVGEELLAGIFQTGPEDIDRIVDDEETVVVLLTDVDGDGRILLVMALYVELLLLGELTGVDSGRDVGCAMAQHRQGIDVNVVVDERDGTLRLFDEVDDMGISIEDLSVVEDALYWWQGRSDKEIDFVFQYTNSLALLQ